MGLERALLYPHQQTPWYEQKPGFFGEGGIDQLRRTWLEQRIAQSADVPVFFIRKRGVEKPSLTDPAGKPVASLKGYEVLLRSREFEYAWEVVESFGGVSFWTAKDAESTYRWPEHVEPAFIGRKVEVIPASRVIPPSGEIQWSTLEPFQKNGRVFVKSMEKIRDRSYGLADMGDDHGLHHFKKFVTSGAIEFFLVSEPVAMLRDAIFRSYEYRCIVAGGNIVSTSFHDCYAHVDIPPTIRERAQVLARHHQEILPWGYIIDIGLDHQENPFLIELNGLSHAGSYRTNHFELFLLEFAPNLNTSQMKKSLPGILEEMKELDRNAPSRGGGSTFHF